MSDVLSERDFLKEIDFTRDELQYLIDLAAELKAAKKSGTEEHLLSGRSIALIFEKTSTRTRCAFEVAAYDQGAHVTYLDPASSQIGHKESAADTGRVLARMFDAIQFRGKSQSTIEELAAYAALLDVLARHSGKAPLWRRAREPETPLEQRSAAPLPA